MIVDHSGTAGTTLVQTTEKLTRAQTTSNMDAHKSDVMPKSDGELQQPQKVFRKVWKEVLKYKLENYEEGIKVPR